jgi:hypothetical protein
MEIVEYTPDWKTRWDAFVEASNNGTMFHLQRFLDYHTQGKFAFLHLLFVDRGNIRAVLPGSLVDGIFESPVGASYGSFVTSSIRFRDAMDIVSALLDYGRKKGIREFLLTPPPLIYERRPSQSLDFALLWQGFRYSLHYIASAVALDPSRDILSRFQMTARRNVRNSIKNPDLRVEVNQRYDEFYPILVENKAKHNVKPTHSLEDLLRLRELLPGRLKLFMLYHRDDPVAGSLVFLANPTVAICFYNMLRYEADHLKPVDRLMYEVVRDATDQGYRYVDIGVSQETAAANPMTPRMSLIDYKENFDARTVMRNTFQYRFDWAG